LIEEYQNGEFLLSSDPEKIDLDKIHLYLSKHSYWAQNIRIDLVRRSINNSLCFGLFHMEEQIGLTRVITDKATFAYLADIYVLDEYQRKGLGTWMIEQVMKSSELQGIRRWQLITRNAQKFYHKFGFKSIEEPERHMTVKFHVDYG